MSAEDDPIGYLVEQRATGCLLDLVEFAFSRLLDAIDDNPELARWHGRHDQRGRVFVLIGADGERGML